MKRGGRAPVFKVPAFFCGRAEEDLHDIQYSVFWDRNGAQDPSITKQ
jgi:hypothetical protein